MLNVLICTSCFIILPVQFVVLILSVIQVVTGNEPYETVDNIIKCICLKKYRSEYPGIIEDSLSVAYAGDGSGRRCCISFEYYSEDGRKISHDIWLGRYKHQRP